MHTCRPNIKLQAYAATCQDVCAGYGLNHQMSIVYSSKARKGILTSAIRGARTEPGRLPAARGLKPTEPAGTHPRPRQLRACACICLHTCVCICGCIHEDMCRQGGDHDPLHLSWQGVAPETAIHTHLGWIGRRSHVLSVTAYLIHISDNTRPGIHVLWKYTRADVLIHAHQPTKTPIILIITAVVSIAALATRRQRLLLLLLHAVGCSLAPSECCLPFARGTKTISCRNGVSSGHHPSGMGADVMNSAAHAAYSACTRAAFKRPSPRQMVFRGAGIPANQRRASLHT